MSAMPSEEIRNPHEVRRGQVCHVFRKLEDGKGEWVCVACWPEKFEAGAQTPEGGTPASAASSGMPFPSTSRLPLLHPGTQ